MGRRPQRQATIGLLALLTTLLVGVPGTAAADGLTLTTPYPAVAVAPGAKVSFDLSIETATSQRVNLSVTGVPADWTAQFLGGGFVVDGILSDGSKATDVRLDVSVPETAGASTVKLVATAVAGGLTTTLPLDIRVTPQAAGEVTLTTDFPQLKGTSTTSFKFNLTLRNDTAEDLTFGGSATGGAGWTVTTQVSSESQAASAIVKAGATTPVTVTATAPANVPAGIYPITVEVTSGTRTATADLAAEVTGSYSLRLTTPDARLNAQASAGSNTDLSLVVQNTGTATITGVKVTATAPTGWTITYEPESVDVEPGVDQTIIAHMTPSGEAIAGDYVVSFRATGEQANGSADVRVTIQTGLLGGAIGIGLIALVLAGLGWVFLRYGRR